MRHLDADDFAAARGEIPALVARKELDRIDPDRHYFRTPLAAAIHRGQVELARALLQAGADPNRKDPYATPLAHALTRASSNGLALASLLLEHGAAVDMPSYEQQHTPIWLAAEKGEEEAVKLLLERGASVDLADRYGETPLMSSATELSVYDGPGAPSLATLAPVTMALLEAGANPNARNATGHSALHVTVMKRNNACAGLLLLEKGASTDSGPKEFEDQGAFAGRLNELAALAALAREGQPPQEIAMRCYRLSARWRGQ